jgi:hypothetical protein
MVLVSSMATAAFLFDLVLSRNASYLNGDSGEHAPKQSTPLAEGERGRKMKQREVLQQGKSRQHVSSVAGLAGNTIGTFRTCIYKHQCLPAGAALGCKSLALRVVASGSHAAPDHWLCAKQHQVFVIKRHLSSVRLTDKSEMRPWSKGQAY